MTLSTQQISDRIEIDDLLADGPCPIIAEGEA